MSFFSLDYLIVYAYLIITLIVGLHAGRKTKDTSDYAIAGKSFAKPVIMLTLIATMVGGGSTTGVAAEIYKNGIIFFFVVTMGIGLSSLIFANFIAPNFDKRFDGMISSSDIVRKYYGSGAEKLTTLISFIFCTTTLMAQITALGHVFTNFMGLEYHIGVLLSGGIVVLYSAFGGIRSVTITDVIQFSILIVMIPLIASVSLNHTGGMTALYSNLPVTHLQIFDHPKFYEYLALFLFWVFPFLLLDPSIVQRYLMTTNGRQIQGISNLYALLKLLLTFMIMTIAFAALKLYPALEANEIIPTMIRDLLPIGIKGLAISGILAVIMSTADSYLNTAGILITQNSGLVRTTNEQTKLRIMVFNTLLIGIIAIVGALYNFSIISLIIFSDAIAFVAIAIPLFAVINRFKVNKKDYWSCIIYGFVAYLTGKILFGLSDLVLPITSTIAGLCGFFISHITRNKGIVIENKFDIITHRKVTRFDWSALIKKLTQLLPTPRNLLRYSTTKVDEYGASYMLFGVFCSLNFIVPFFMWGYTEPREYPLVLTMRMLAGFLCVGLMLKDYWPNNMRKVFPIYWHLTLMYCLPLITTFMWLIDEYSMWWMLNMALAIFMLSALVDWLTFLILMMVGASIAFAIFTLVSGGLYTSLENPESIYVAMYTIFFATMIGLLFTRSQNMKNADRFEAMRLFGSAMAHEVATPFASTKMNVDAIKSILTGSLKGSKPNKDGTISLKLSPEEFEMLVDKIPNTLEKTVAKGVQTIDNLLVSMKENFTSDDEGVYSISDIINECLIEFALSRSDSERISFDSRSDFQVQGSKFFLKHVFYNLIKNAFKYAGSKAKITIWLKDHTVYFHDNGHGISISDLPKIFKRFYSKDKHGTGIGLAFCKQVMDSIGGNIKCSSVAGEYTEFALKFQPQKTMDKTN